jgi:hypothetical protein
MSAPTPAPFDSPSASPTSAPTAAARVDVITAYQAALIFVDITGLIGLIWFWLRRNRFPIRNRVPWTVMLQSASFLVTANILMLVGLGFNDAMTCVSYLVPLYVSGFITTFIVVM